MKLVRWRALLIRSFHRHLTCYHSCFDVNFDIRRWDFLYFFLFFFTRSILRSRENRLVSRAVNIRFMRWLYAISAELILSYAVIITTKVILKRVHPIGILLFKWRNYNITSLWWNKLLEGCTWIRFAWLWCCKLGERATVLPKSSDLVGSYAFIVNFFNLCTSYQFFLAILIGPNSNSKLKLCSSFLSIQIRHLGILCFCSRTNSNKSTKLFKNIFTYAQTKTDSIRIQLCTIFQLWEGHK